MKLFELKVIDLNSHREVTQISMIDDMDLKDKQSILEIMEKIGKLVVEFIEKKERQEAK